ncbi:MAG: NAD(P)H-dependent oxidoreductase [Pseudomonadota bacterium]
MKILGISGSFRTASYNTGLLRAASAFVPDGIEILQYNYIGLYNGDDEAAHGIPDGVQEIAERIAQADGLFFATPEYNFSIPGGLKNLIDWLSRVKPMPFAGKPTAIMGAAAGPMGTGRVQYDLRKVLNALDADIVNKPEVFVGLAGTKFDENGDLTDDTSRGFVRLLTEALQKKIEG